MWQHYDETGREIDQNGDADLYTAMCYWHGWEHDRKPGFMLPDGPPIGIVIVEADDGEVLGSIRYKEVDSK